MTIPADNRGDANTNTRNRTARFTSGYRITQPERPFEQYDQAADKISDNFLQSEADPHAQYGDEPLQFCPLQSDGIYRQNNSDGRDGVAGGPYERAAGTGIHGKAIEQGNFQQARSEEN